MAVEYVRQDIALQIIADRVGHETMDELWAGDPELRGLLGDHDRRAALLRAAGSPGRPGARSQQAGGRSHEPGVPPREPEASHGRPRADDPADDG